MTSLLKFFNTKPKGAKVKLVLAIVLPILTTFHNDQRSLSGVAEPAEALYLKQQKQQTSTKKSFGGQQQSTTTATGTTNTSTNADPSTYYTQYGYTYGIDPASSTEQQQKQPQLNLNTYTPPLPPLPSPPPPYPTFPPGIPQPSSPSAASEYPVSDFEFAPPGDLSCHKTTKTNVSHQMITTPEDCNYIVRLLGAEAGQDDIDGTANGMTDFYHFNEIGVNVVGLMKDEDTFNRDMRYWPRGCFIFDNSLPVQSQWNSGELQFRPWQNSPKYTGVFFNMYMNVKQEENERQARDTAYYWHLSQLRREMWQRTGTTGYQYDPITGVPLDPIKHLQLLPEKIRVGMTEAEMQQEDSALKLAGLYGGGNVYSDKNFTGSKWEYNFPIDKVRVVCAKRDIFERQKNRARPQTSNNVIRRWDDKDSKYSTEVTNSRKQQHKFLISEPKIYPHALATHRDCWPQWKTQQVPKVRFDLSDVGELNCIGHWDNAANAALAMQHKDSTAPLYMYSKLQSELQTLQTYKHTKGDGPWFGVIDSPESCDYATRVIGLQQYGFIDDDFSGTKEKSDHSEEFIDFDFDLNRPRQGYGQRWIHNKKYWVQHISQSYYGNSGTGMGVIQENAIMHPRGCYWYWNDHKYSAGGGLSDSYNNNPGNGNETNGNSHPYDMINLWGQETNKGSGAQKHPMVGSVHVFFNHAPGELTEQQYEDFIKSRGPDNPVRAVCKNSKKWAFGKKSLNPGHHDMSAATDSHYDPLKFSAADRAHFTPAGHVKHRGQDLYTQLQHWQMTIQGQTKDVLEYLPNNELPEWPFTILQAQSGIFPPAPPPSPTPPPSPPGFPPPLLPEDLVAVQHQGNGVALGVGLGLGLPFAGGLVFSFGGLLCGMGCCFGLIGKMRRNRAIEKMKENLRKSTMHTIGNRISESSLNAVISGRSSSNSNSNSVSVSSTSNGFNSAININLTSKEINKSQSTDQHDSTRSQIESQLHDYLIKPFNKIFTLANVHVKKQQNDDAGLVKNQQVQYGYGQGAGEMGNYVSESKSPEQIAISHLQTTQGLNNTNSPKRSPGQTQSPVGSPISERREAKPIADLEFTTIIENGKDVVDPNPKSPVSASAKNKN